MYKTISSLQIAYISTCNMTAKTSKIHQQYCFFLPVDVEGCAPSSLPLVIFLVDGSDLGPMISSPTTSNSKSFARSSLLKKIQTTISFYMGMAAW